MWQNNETKRYKKEEKTPVTALERLFTKRQATVLEARLRNNLTFHFLSVFFSQRQSKNDRNIN